jgi:hypothetical protein
MSIKRTIKRLIAVLTCLAGIPLLMIARQTGDPVIRVLASVAGVCLLVSGSMQFWLMRTRKKKRAWGDEIPY